MKERYEEISTPTSSWPPMGSDACPKCSFPIPGRALECPACGIVYAKFGAVAPRRNREHLVWREGSLLVLRRGARLPARCLRCNRTATERLRKSFWWFPEAIVWVARYSFGLALPLAVLFLQTAEVTLPLCTIHHRSRKVALWTGWLLVAGGVVVLAVCVFLNIPIDKLYWLTVGPIMGVIGMFPIFIAIGIVVPNKIDREHVWLRKVCREYLDLLPEGPHDL